MTTRKSRCAGERSSERENLHGTFRRLMNVGGFFVLLVRHPKHQPEVRKTKSKNTYRTRVVCGINRRSLGTDREDHDASTCPNSK